MISIPPLTSFPDGPGPGLALHLPLRGLGRPPRPQRPLALRPRGGPLGQAVGGRGGRRRTKSEVMPQDGARRTARKHIRAGELFLIPFRSCGEEQIVTLKKMHWVEKSVVDV